jgi:hypothetical protein
MITAVAICVSLVVLSLAILMTLAHALRDEGRLPDVAPKTLVDVPTHARMRGLKAVEEALGLSHPTLLAISEEQHWRFVAQAYALKQTSVEASKPLMLQQGPMAAMLDVACTS